MKAKHGKNLSTLFGLFALCILVWINPARAGIPDLPDGVKPSEWQSVAAQIQAHQHQIVETDTGFAAKNNGQQWRTEFDPKGFLGGGVWSQQAYLKASNTDGGDRFGWSVAVSGDTVVVGAYYEDSSATGVDGNQADNSASSSGAVHVFTGVAAPNTAPTLDNSGTRVREMPKKLMVKFESINGISHTLLGCLLKSGEKLLCTSVSA